MMIRHVIIAVLFILISSCKTTETGQTRELENGDKQTEVSSEIMGVPVPFTSRWTKQKTEWQKSVEQVKEPLWYAQWALLAGFIGCSIACMYVSMPKLQKKLAKIAVALGVAYGGSVAIFMVMSLTLGHPWWLALVALLIASVGCWIFWKKEHGDK